MTNREYIIDYLKTLHVKTNYENRNNGSIAASFCDIFFNDLNDNTCDSCPYDSTGCIPLSEERLNEFMEREFSGKEPEVKIRKKGKWIKVGGFATPGGDPVWRCSVCGKGQHVYGIEASSYAKDVSDHQWLSCPNCDAEMSE